MCIRDRDGTVEMIDNPTNYPDPSLIQMAEEPVNKIVTVGTAVQSSAVEAPHQSQQTPVSYTHLDVYKRQSVSRVPPDT